MSLPKFIRVKMKKIMLLLIFSVLLFGCTRIQQNAPPSGPTKEFTITANQRTFEPSEITLNKNDRVVLQIVSIDEEYDFTLDEFGISIQFQPGTNANVEFIADKEGTFTFRCSILCKGKPEMEGKIIVKG